MARKRERACGGKVRYRDHDEAVRALHLLQGSEREVFPTRAYPCPRCAGWHLTSKPKRGAA